MSLEEIQGFAPHTLTGADEYIPEDYVWRECLREDTSLRSSSVIVICEELAQIIIGCGGSYLVPCHRLVSFRSFRHKSHGQANEILPVGLFHH